MSTRTDLAVALRTALAAARFDVLDVWDLPDTIKRSTVVVRQEGYSQAPEATRSFMDARFKVTVASHHVDIDKAETALDADVATVMEALDRDLGLTWTTVDRTLTKTYHSFDITCSKPTPTPY